MNIQGNIAGFRRNADVEVKTILALIVVLFLGIYSVSGQNAPVSTIGNVVSYGTTATVPVTATNISDIGSFSMKISYDPSVVNPVSATVSAAMGGSLSVNLTNPGFIYLSWFTYPGVTLSGSQVILNIDFTKVSPGTSALAWSDDGFSCSWYDGNNVALNDVPASSYYIPGSVAFATPDAPHSILPVLAICQGSVFSVPVRVTDFTNIGQVALTLHYNSPALNYQSFANTSGFPGLTADGTQPGTVTITGAVPSGGSGIFLPDSSVLFTLNFLHLGGSTGLTWYDLGASCQYGGPPPSYPVLNDLPQNAFYFNGSVAGTDLPGPAGTISGPLAGNVCAGETGVQFSVDPIPGACTYLWNLPPDAVVTGGAGTNSIVVSFGSTPGSWSVSVSGNNTCGYGPASPPFSLYINEPPGITGQPGSPPSVNAGSGTATFHVGATGSLLTYQWQEGPGTWISLADSGVYSGSATPVLSVTNPPAGMNGRHYRCIIGGMCPPDVITDGEAMLSVGNVNGQNNNGPGTVNQAAFSCYPNPTMGKITLEYTIPEDGYAVLEIINMYGISAGVLIDSKVNSGTYVMEAGIDGEPGIYLAVLALDTGKYFFRRNVIIIKR